MRYVYAAVVVFLLAGTATAQNIAPKGSDATFDVATWNIEMFGSESNGPTDEAEQLQNVARVIEESDIDLWAVQEIDDEDAFEALLAELGSGYDGYLGRGSTNLMMGFVFKTAVVDPIQVSDAWLRQEEYMHPFAGRPPLLMLADIILPDTTVGLYLVSLHMKCCGDPGEYDQRRDASIALKNRIDGLHTSDPFVILGDFNDELSGSISGSNPTPYENFLSDPEDYRFISRVLDENDEETWCGNPSCSSGSIFDHVLITNELFDAYVDGSTDRYDELLDAIDPYVYSTSDHLPVYARFAFPTHTAVEDFPGDTFGLDSIHPNPVTTTTASLDFRLSTAAWVDVRIYDALGREAARSAGSFRAAGPHRTEISVDNLAAGLYFVRLDAGRNRDVKPLLIAR